MPAESRRGRVATPPSRGGGGRRRARPWRWRRRRRARHGGVGAAGGRLDGLPAGPRRRWRRNGHGDGDRPAARRRRRHGAGASARIYVADTSGTSCPAGLASTTAGDIYLVSGLGSGDPVSGMALQGANLDRPGGVTVSPAGQLLIADTQDNAVWAADGTTGVVPPALTLATTSLPGAAVGSAYSTTLTAANGRAPYAWSVTGSPLPPGLLLNGTTGTISGTPTAAGDASVTSRSPRPARRPPRRRSRSTSPPPRPPPNRPPPNRPQPSRPRSCRPSRRPRPRRPSRVRGRGLSSHGDRAVEPAGARRLVAVEWLRKRLEGQAGAGRR